MKKLAWRYALPILALVLPCMLQGCLAVVGAAAVGVGYYQYDNNEVSRDFKYDLGDTWKATLAALRESGVEVSTDLEHAATEGVIDLETQDLWVKVESHAEGFTRVRVRIGTFATQEHHRRSELLLDSIAKRLD